MKLNIEKALSISFSFWWTKILIQFSLFALYRCRCFSTCSQSKSKHIAKRKMENKTYLSANETWWLTVFLSWTTWETRHSTKWILINEMLIIFVSFSISHHSRTRQCFWSVISNFHHHFVIDLSSLLNTSRGKKVRFLYTFWSSMKDKLKDRWFLKFFTKKKFRLTKCGA